MSDIIELSNLPKVCAVKNRTEQSHFRDHRRKEFKHYLFLKWGSLVSSLPLHERALRDGIELRTLKKSSLHSSLLFVTSMFCRAEHSWKCLIESGVSRKFLERFIVCRAGQQERLLICASRLFDKSKMVKSFSVSKPWILVTKFLLRYKHLNFSRHCKFSISEKPLLSSHIALQLIYCSRFSILLKPLKCR